MSMLYYIIIIWIVAGGYITVCAYLYFFQRELLYFPIKEMEKPEFYGLKHTSEISVTTNDGINIILWYSPPRKGEPVMVYLHGNAGNLGDRSEKLSIFMQQGFGLLAVSYRGYGHSEGQPTENGLYEDARAAISFLKLQNIPENDIFLYGESLGSGVAVQIATEYNLKALVLEAPYSSVAKRAKELHPFIAVDFLMKDKFLSIDKIGSITMPLLIFHGYLDQVMPIHHGRKMLEAAIKSTRKEARFFENTGHTDFDHSKLARLTYDFVMDRE